MRIEMWEKEMPKLWKAERPRLNFSIEIWNGESRNGRKWRKRARKQGQFG